MNITKRNLQYIKKRKNQSKKKLDRYKHKQKRKTAKHKKHTNLLFKTIKQNNRRHLDKINNKVYYGGDKYQDEARQRRLQRAEAKTRNLRRLAQDTNDSSINEQLAQAQRQKEQARQDIIYSKSGINVNNRPYSDTRDTNNMLSVDNRIEQSYSFKNAKKVIETDMKKNGVPFAFYGTDLNSNILLKNDITTFDKLLLLNEDQLNNIYTQLRVSDVIKNKVNTLIQNAKDKSVVTKTPMKTNKNNQLKKLLLQQKQLEDKNKELKRNLHYLQNKMKTGERTCFNTTSTTGDIVKICVEEDKSFKNWVNNAVKPKSPKKITTTKT